MPTISGLLGAGSCALRPELRGYSRKPRPRAENTKGVSLFAKLEGKPEEPLIPQASLNPQTRRDLRGENPWDAQAPS